MKKWIILLGLLSQVTWAASNSLTLYFIPSPVGMDWSTPANLTWSAMKNRLSFQTRFMGHVFVDLECGEKKEVTGMVGKNFDYLNQLLIQNRGLGILYHSFEGRLEDKDQVLEEIKDLSEDEGRMNFVRFELNQGQCDRAMAYITEYREKDVGRYYGLANRPLYAEGAGCSAFAASFAQVTGVIDTDMNDSWSQSVNVPLAFAGPPLRDEGVSLLKLILNAQGWAKDTDPHKKLTFWSPDRMFDWVNMKISKSSTEKQFTVTSLGKSPGIIFDKKILPAPSGPIWQQHLEANLKFSNSKK